MRLLQRAVFAALLIGIVATSFTLVGINCPQALRAVAAQPSVTASCGGYGPQCSPSPRPSRTPPTQASPSPSAPVTTASPSPSGSVVCVPGSPSCLPLTGESVAVRWGLPLGVLLVGVGGLMLWCARRRRVPQDDGQ